MSSIYSYSKLPFLGCFLSSSWVGQVYSAAKRPGLFSIDGLSLSFSATVWTHLDLVAPSTYLERSSSSKEALRDDFLELTIDCALDVDITFSFSLLDSLTGQGSVATSILLIFHAILS